MKASEVAAALSWWLSLSDGHAKEGHWVGGAMGARCTWEEDIGGFGGRGDSRLEDVNSKRVAKSCQNVVLPRLPCSSRSSATR